MNTKTVYKQHNISIKALRIYEDLGIIVPKRDKNNYRNYSEIDILKLRQVIVLKEMGISLKNIKQLLSKEFNEDNKIIRALELQLKAVDIKISELENIKITLQQGVNEVLNARQGINYSEYFSKMDKCFSEKKENEDVWLDKWGFDSWAKNYDNSVMESSKDGLKLFEKYDIVLECVADKIFMNNGAKVLDIGCGTGNLYSKLKNNINFTGIDQSIEMLLQAKGKFPEMNLRLGTFLDEPFVEDEFDVVTSTFAFHHLNGMEKQRAIILLLRYLKPNGIIIIADLMFMNDIERIKQKDYYLENDKEDLWNIIEDEYYTDVEKIRKYAQQLGCAFRYEHMVNFTWIIEIVKRMC